MAAPDPHYDILSALYTYAPGVEAQRAIIDGLEAAYAAGDYQPLTSAQVLAVTGPPPAPLTSIRNLRGPDGAPFCG
jgi:hypothetical protein